MSHGRRIGRVKLITPAAEVAEKYLRIWSKRDLYNNPGAFPPISGQGLFGIDQPIHLEIGCGTGEYLIAQAEHQPDDLFLAVEVSRRAIFHAVNQASRRNIQNILFIYTDFKLTYPLLRPETFKAVYLHYPDTNYPSRFAQRRIFDRKLLDRMHRALTSQGIISVVTDQERLFKQISELVDLDERFTKTHNEDYLTQFETPVKTRFQRAWERAERPVFHLVITKQDRSQG
jgi:tRNA (guanine-N7-)-methyltransferase